MPEVSAREAAQIINVGHMTIRRYVKAGRLPARNEGIRGIIKIEVDDLRQFAERYQYRFNEDLATQLAQ